MDDNDNLKDIMVQLGTLEDDEKRIKEELFRLLWFFVMTYESRQERVKTTIRRNKENFKRVVEDFIELGVEEEQQMLEGLIAKLDTISD